LILIIFHNQNLKRFLGHQCGRTAGIAVGVVLGVAIGVAAGVQEDTIFFITNHKFAGLSAKRLIYHGNQAVP